MRKLGALLDKDARDLLKNPTMVVAVIMPVALTLFYRFSFRDALAAGESDPAMRLIVDGIFLVIALCMSVGVVGATVLVYGIAEEKEKHTLRTLMLANVSAEQIMLARGLVTLVVTAVVEALCFFVSGAPMHLFAPYMAIGVLGALPIILLSLVLGLASRDQMTAGLYSVPILLVVIAPMLSGFSPMLGDIARFLPTGGAASLLRLATEGALFGSEAVLPLAVTAAWIVLGLVVFKLLYRKLATDN